MERLEDLRDEAEDNRRERMDDGTWNGEYELSVFADLPAVDEGDDNLVVRVTLGHLKVKWYRVAASRSLLDAGFQLRASPPEPYHYDAILGPDLTTEVLELFRQSFSEIRRNALWRR